MNDTNFLSFNDMISKYSTNDSKSSQLNSKLFENATFEISDDKNLLGSANAEIKSIVMKNGGTIADRESKHRTYFVCDNIDPSLKIKSYNKIVTSNYIVIFFC